MIAVSPTEITLYCTCPRKWELARRWVPVPEPPGLALGSGFHTAIATWLRTNDPELALTEAEKDLARADPTLKGLLLAKLRILFDYVRKVGLPGTPKEIEFSFQVPLDEDVALKGRVDLLFTKEDELWLLDWKTGRIPSLDWMRDIADQLTMYIAALRLLDYPIEGGVWFCLGLPELRKKESEEFWEYIRRIETKFAEEEARWVCQLWYIPSDKAIEDALEKIRLVTRRIAAHEIYRNPEACRWLGCPYAVICQDDRNALLCGFKPKEEAAMEEDLGDEGP